MSLTYTTLDVFTDERFRGNQLAIIQVPPAVQLDQKQRQSIANEFNFAETVFMHIPDTLSPSNKNLEVFINIHTPFEEVPFAGHPTVGSSWYLLNHIQLAADISLVLKTKAGRIPVTRNGSNVRLETPVDFKIHKPWAHPTLRALQATLKSSDYYYGDAPLPVVSIVKGMTFFPLRLTSLEALEKFQPFPTREVLPGGYLGEWEGLVCVDAYVILDTKDPVSKIRVRLMDGWLEDPATGSAASALSGYLATEWFKENGKREFAFEIVQGVEMGRRSEIYTWVFLDEEGHVQRIDLEGTAVTVMQGALYYV